MPVVSIDWVSGPSPEMRTEVTEHDMTVVFGIATRISVLHHGEVIASGTPAEVRANAAVQEVYLGRSAN